MQDEAKVKLAEKQTQRSYFKRMRKAILGVCSLWGVHPAPSCTRSAHRHVGRAHVRTREIERRRVEWVTSYLGTSDYKFGDLTQKFVRDITGKEDYEFGDVTRKAVSSFTGKDEYEFGDISKKLFGDMKKMFGQK